MWLYHLLDNIQLSSILQPVRVSAASVWLRWACVLWVQAPGLQPAQTLHRAAGGVDPLSRDTDR